MTEGEFRAQKNLLAAWDEATLVARAPPYAASGVFPPPGGGLNVQLPFKALLFLIFSFSQAFNF